MKLSEFRAQFPQYNDMSDQALADALHRKFYSDIPKAEFDKKIGLAATAPKPEADEFANTAAITAAGAVKGGREAANPLNLISSLVSNAGPIGYENAVKTLGVERIAPKIADWAKRNAPVADPLSAHKVANPELYKAYTGVTGDSIGDSPEVTAQKRGAEMTPLRKGLAAAAEIGAGSLPFIATGPVGAGLKLAGASAALGGLGETIGGDTGKIIGASIPLLAAFRGKRPPAPPSSEALKDQAQNAYRAAESAGVVIGEASFENAFLNIAKDAAKQGLHPKLHPRALAALESLGNEVGKPLTLEKADTLRKVLKNAASTADASERRIVMRAVDKFDDYIAGLKPTDVLAGDAKAATEALTEARGLWSKARKSEAVEDLMERAKTRASQFSGSGYENALRTEFRNLIMNPRKMRVFSAEEQDAIKKVAKGGALENSLRMLGKFAPTGVVSSALSGGMGFAAAGPAGAVALPALGFAARRGATALTERNAKLAAELMRRGSPIPPSLRPFLPALPAALAPRVTGE